MRATGQTAILVAILLLLPACTSPLDIPKDPSTVQAYKRLRVAVVEPAPTGDRFNAGIVEDTTRTFVTYFGSVTIAKSVEEARASNPDLIATLSIDTDPSTHIFSNSRIDVHVRFASSDPRRNGERRRLARRSTDFASSRSIANR
jgi:hypothetical protein